MGKKTVFAVVIVLMAILVLVVVYNVEESRNVAFENVELDLYSEGPIELSKIIEEVETSSYYEGYDNQTLNWMKSLGNKKVFSGNGTFVIMDSYDANKIPSVYATDVIMMEHIRCDVLEKHSLGNGKYPKDVLLIRNVEYLGEEITGSGWA